MNTTIIIGIVVTIVILLIIIIVSIVLQKKRNTVTVTQQPVSVPTSSIIPSIAPNDPVPALIDFVKNTNKVVAWSGMTYKTDQDVKNLDYLISCNKPWGAYYKIGCTLNGKTIYTNPYGPVSDNNKQGPDIRIAPDKENNYCAQIGGQLSVIRQRPGDKEMIDITDFLQNSTTTGPYNKVDPVFVDNYLTDC